MGAAYNCSASASAKTAARTGGGTSWLLVGCWVQRSTAREQARSSCLQLPPSSAPYKRQQAATSSEECVVHKATHQSGRTTAMDVHY